MQTSSPNREEEKKKKAPCSSFNSMAKIFAILKSQHYYITFPIYQSPKHAISVLKAFLCTNLCFDSTPAYPK